VPAEVGERLAAADRALLATDVRTRQFSADARRALARAMDLKARAIASFGLGALPTGFFAFLGVAVGLESEASLPSKITAMLFFSAPFLLFVGIGFIAWTMLDTARNRLFAASAAIPPPRPGEPATCALCGAPIAPSAHEIVARCAHCGTDNVVHPLAFARAIRQRAVDVGAMHGSLVARSALVDAAARRVRRTLALAIVVTPVLGWASAFMLLVVGIGVDSVIEPPANPAARYVTIDTPKGRCIAKLKTKKGQVIADFGPGSGLPRDSAVGADVPRFSPEAIVGKRVRLRRGPAGVVRKVYARRIIDEDTMVLDPKGEEDLRGACFVAP
jgi:hypothetical protein